MSDLRHWCTRIRRGLFALTAAGAIGLTGTASGQFGEAAGFGEVMGPYYFKRDLVHFIDGLNLDDSQTVILESLYWDYTDAQEASKQEMIERLQNMREQFETLDRDRIMQIIFTPFEDRCAEWEALNEQFVQSVQSILNSTQLQRWPQFRQKLRREKQLPRGRLTGERLDLFHILEEIDLDEPTRVLIEPTLRQYANSLDEALTRRQDLFRESRLLMMHSIRDEEPEAALKIYQDQVDARVRVRNVNDEYTEAIATALPDEAGATFLETARERAYPRVFRTTAAQRVFEAALELSGLDPATLKAIDDLFREYLTRLDAINERILRLTREYEPKEQEYRAAVFALRGTGQRPDRPVDPTRAEFRKRDDLGREYIERLRALLTDEQFRGLPGINRFLNERRSHGRLDPDRVKGVGTTRDGKSGGTPNRRNKDAGISRSGSGGAGNTSNKGSGGPK
ncbi:MAG: hypothetical protein SYC29_07100 [Planctomycetota bacterium]|nr:hypothetical protein [Planctomycetota bacterium]